MLPVDKVWRGNLALNLSYQAEIYYATNLDKNIKFCQSHNQDFHFLNLIKITYLPAMFTEAFDINLEEQIFITAAELRLFISLPLYDCNTLHNDFRNAIAETKTPKKSTSNFCTSK